MIADNNSNFKLLMKKSQKLPTTLKGPIKTLLRILITLIDLNSKEDELTCHGANLQLKILK